MKRVLRSVNPNSAWLVCLLFVPLASAQVQHTTKAETDRFLLCARAAFQKPVYTTIHGPWFDADMSCSSEREEIIRELQDRKIPAFENDSAILLLPSGMRPDIGITDRYGHKVTWHKFEINVHVGSFGDTLPQGSRPLRKDERDRVAKAILDQALPPPLVPAYADVADDSGEMTVDLFLDAHHLSTDTESVVAVFGAGGATRLAYGELIHGTYRMLWDTPLLGPDVDVSYNDVNGDGIQEIVAQWTESGGSVSYEALAVFNSKGEELTRQEECYPRPHAEPAQFACPIWGSDIEFEKNSSGKYDILEVPNDQANPEDAARFTLVDGRYIRSKKLNGPTTKKR